MNRIAKMSAAPAAVFLLLFLYFPLAKLILAAGDGASLWRDELFQRVFVFTYLQAFLSASLSLLVGCLGAWVLSEYQFRGRDLLRRTHLIFFSLPSLLVALMIVSFWGRNGVGRLFPDFLLYGWFGILVGHTFLNAPLFVEWVGLALRQRDRISERAARSLGASPWQAFRVAVLPGIFPALKSAFAMSFLLASSSFMIVMLLGGGPRFETLELSVYGAIKTNLDLPLAVRIAAVQLAISTLIYFLFLRRTRQVERHNLDFPGTSHLSATGGFLMSLYLVVWLLLFVAPLGFWLVTSLTGFFRLDLTTLIFAVKTSLLIALSVGVLSVLFALSAAYYVRHFPDGILSRFLSFSMTLPVSLSSVIFSFAILLVWKETVFASSWGGIPIVVVQSILCLPFIFRILRDGMQRMNDEMLRAGRTLGGHAGQVFWYLELPFLKGAIVGAFLTAMAFSMGEVGALLVFHANDTLTLSRWIAELMALYRFEEAFSVGTALVFFMFLLFAGVNRWQRA